MSQGYLFSGGYLSDWLEARRKQASEAVASIPAETVLRVPEPDLVDELVDRLRLEDRYSPKGAEDVQIDVSGDPRRMVFLLHRRHAYRRPCAF